MTSYQSRNLAIVFAVACAFSIQYGASEARAQETPPLGIRAGQAHPDFMLPKIDGGHGRLSDYRGKKILLFHFASW
jgi:hypothetical protein